MLNMENAEEVMQILERFTRLKQKEIPKELDDYMHYVAKTGDTVFKWSSLKYLFREKLLNVIKNFHDTSPRVDDLPQYPNVDPFNYESMKSSLLERLELFNAAPFTVQRLCELLTEPRKQYSRIDKFMRALEKNILVVSTIEPGRKQTESENGDSLDSVVNGDVSLDVNVDIEMENETIFNAADAPSNATPSESTPAQPSSNLIHKADDDILPNPKKAKLDLGENNDAEIEAATKSIASNKSESTIPSAEVPMAEETAADVSEKKTSEESPCEDKPAAIENVAEKDNNDAKSEKMEEDIPAPTGASTEAKSDKQPEKVDATPIPASTVHVTQEVSEDSKTVEEKNNGVDADVKKVEKESLGKKDDCSQEKVIEKVNEVVEKENVNKEEDQNGDVKPSELKTETNITSAKATSDKHSGKIPEESKAKTENESESEKSAIGESSVTISANEPKTETAPTTKDEGKCEDKDNVKTDEATPASNESAPVEKTQKTGNEKSIVMEVDSSLQAKTAAIESPQKDNVAKSDEVKTTDVTEKETEKPKIVDSPSEQTAAVDTAEKIAETPAEAIAEKTKEDVAPVSKAEIEEVVMEKSSPENAKDENTEIEKPATEKSEIAVAEAISHSSADTPVIVAHSNDSPTTEPAETKPETTTPTLLVTSPEAELTTTPAVVEVPTISADQPMEENPESIAEAEPVVPAIVEAATTVEEVVMGGDSVEMATDAIEPAKDEPAGMEVDDTSQEAMDQ